MGEYKLIPGLNLNALIIRPFICVSTVMASKQVLKMRIRGGERKVLSNLGKLKLLKTLPAVRMLSDLRKHSQHLVRMIEMESLKHAC